jgi:predicted anti-sigma-YlaC factor YlaD
MHQPVKDNLEEYLKGVSGRFQKPLPPDVEKHLEACGECRKELKEFERQTVALRSLRVSGDAEPRPGFYARVMHRIDEARATSSVWAAFLEPIFAKRLALASAALVVLLGAFWITTEPRDIGAPPRTPAIQTAVDLDNTTPQERDAVLAELVSFGD